MCTCFLFGSLVACARVVGVVCFDFLYPGYGLVLSLVGMHVCPVCGGFLMAFCVLAVAFFSL